jgi:hypothetical protein
MLGQTMVRPAASPRHKFSLSPRLRPTSTWLRPSVELQCETCGLGAVAPVIDLGNADVLRELKTLMTLLTPSLAQQGEGWFTAGWSKGDWESYKVILAKLPGTATDKRKLVAYADKSGGIVLGMPPVGVTGFPSIWGIDAMGERLITLGTMTDASLAAAFPTLDAAGKAAATSTKPTEAGVTAPSSGGGIPMYVIVAGVGVLAIGAYLIFRK